MHPRSLLVDRGDEPGGVRTGEHALIHGDDDQQLLDAGALQLRLHLATLHHLSRCEQLERDGLLREEVVVLASHGRPSIAP